MGADDAVCLGIVDAGQVESVGHEGRWGFEAAAFLNQCGEAFDAEPAAADINERAHDVAYHMVQKGVAVQIEADESCTLGKVGAVDGFDGGFCLALGGAEAGEVLFADQIGGSLPHLPDVEFEVCPACPVFEHGGTDGGGFEQVAVVPSVCVEAGVKFGCDLSSVQNGNAFGQVGVHAAYPCLLGTDGSCVKVDDLGGGVHAGVGSASNGGGDRFSCDLGKCVFQCRLNGRYAACLFLPAVKAAAVVG